MSSTVFSILGKNIKATTAEEIKPFLAELEANDAVEEVHFGGNSLGVGACEAIAEALKGKNNLKVADFADIFTGRLITEIPTALSALCDGLQDHPTLVEIDLSDNAFGSRCAPSLVPFLQKTKIQIFKLNNNGLSPQGGRIVAGAILENKQPALRVIHCGRNRLENGSAKTWAQAFAHLGASLEEVRMPQNGIRMEGIAELAAGLAQCPNLKHLDLQDNTATVSGTRALIAGLPSWPGLRVLNLSDCILGKKGGLALAQALGRGGNKKLEVLKLQYGEFDGRAIEAFALAITDHLSLLTTLELNGNVADADDDCIIKIRAALELHGNEDALDELDDMEEPGSDDEDEDEEEAAENASDDDEEAEDELEKEVKEMDDKAQKVNEGILPPVSDKDTDELADLLAGVHVKSS